MLLLLAVGQLARRAYEGSMMGVRVRLEARSADEADVVVTCLGRRLTSGRVRAACGDDAPPLLLDAEMEAYLRRRKVTLHNIDVRDEHVDVRATVALLGERRLRLLPVDE